jgi:hypothetical protein
MWHQPFQQHVKNKNDFLLDVNRGVVEGVSTFHRFGHNDAVGTAWEVVHNLGVDPITTAVTPTTTSVVSIVSTSLNDAAGQSGARSVNLTYLNPAFKEINETIALDGTTPVTSTYEAARVIRAQVAEVGTGGTGWNEGDITFTVGGTDCLRIETSRGTSETTLYTVPSGKTAYLTNLNIWVDAQKPVDVRLIVRPGGFLTGVTAYSKRVQVDFDQVASLAALAYNTYVALGERTDLWFEAQVNTGSAHVHIDYDLYLVDNYIS